MGFEVEMMKKRFLVDTRTLEKTFDIPKCERLFSRGQNEYTFERKLTAEQFRLSCLVDKCIENKLPTEKIREELDRLEDDHPEWMI